jgi:hypothetical protein
MRPLYIFDLDGTLALTDHRQHFIRQEKPDWVSFFAACVDDQPNNPVIQTFRLLRQFGAEVWIWSGRSDEVFKETTNWLDKFIFFDGNAGATLRMRSEGDYTPDEVLKMDWLAAMNPFDRSRLVAVFDDRDKVVKNWREKGVACFQVAPGDF